MKQTGTAGQTHIARKFKLLSWLIFVPALILLPGTGVKAEAQTIEPLSSFNIDPSLVKQDENFGQPNSIVVAPIFLHQDILIQEKDWYEGIFYYMTQRLGQGDFLAHYFVTADGEVLQGNSRGEEQRFLMADSDDRPVIVIYLATQEQTDFSAKSEAALATLITEIANRNSIKPASVKLRTLSYTLKENTPVTLSEQVLGGLWEISMGEILKKVTPLYKPVRHQFDLKVEKVEFPKTEVNYGDSVQLSLTLKNNSQRILYQGTDYEPLMEKVGREASKFAVNGTWISRSQAALMREDTFIRPGESVAYSVELEVPLYFGLQQENFQLTDQLGKVYPGTNFEVALTIKHPERTVVEITQTETGQLNVREGPYGNAKVTGKVTPGQRLFVLERTDSGFTKLDLGNGKSGWVVSRYTKIV